MIRTRLQLFILAFALFTFGAMAQEQTQPQPPAGQEQQQPPAGQQQQEQPAEPAQQQPTEPAQQQPAEPAQQQPGQQQPGQAGQQAGQQGAMSPDQLFVNAAALSNMFEIQASTLAQEKAASPEVQEFAQQMIEDHTAAGEQLNELAGTLGLQAPQEMSAEQQFSLQYLMELEGEDFEQRYLEGQLIAHQAAVALFRMESEVAEDDALREFATTSLPTLEEHLSMARDLLEQMVGAEGQQPAGGQQEGQQQTGDQPAGQQPAGGQQEGQQPGDQPAGQQPGDQQEGQDQEQPGGAEGEGGQGEGGQGQGEGQ